MSPKKYYRPNKEKCVHNKKLAHSAHMVISIENEIVIEMQIDNEINFVFHNTHFANHYIHYTNHIYNNILIILFKLLILY